MLASLAHTTINLPLLMLALINTKLKYDKIHVITSNMFFDTTLPLQGVLIRYIPLWLVTKANVNVPLTTIDNTPLVMLMLISVKPK